MYKEVQCVWITIILDLKFIKMAKRNKKLNTTKNRKFPVNLNSAAKI